MIEGYLILIGYIQQNDCSQDFRYDPFIHIEYFVPLCFVLFDSLDELHYIRLSNRFIFE